MPTPSFQEFDWPTLLRVAQRNAVTGARTLVSGTTTFTVVGGPIHIFSLVSECMTANDGTASTLQWSADGDAGAATTFTGASASLASAAAGTLAVCNLTALSTAPDLLTNGVGLGPVLARGVIVPAGIITTTIGVGSTTGTWRHFLRFTPLGRDVQVIPAF